MASESNAYEIAERLVVQKAMSADRENLVIFGKIELNQSKKGKKVNFKKRLALLLMTLNVSFLSACRKEEDNTSDLDAASPGDQLGATCYSYPYLVPAGDVPKYNLCYSTGSTFYAGILATFAIDSAIQACKNLNALDNGYRAGPGKSCWLECARVTYCLPLASQ